MESRGFEVYKQEKFGHRHSTMGLQVSNFLMVPICQSVCMYVCMHSTHSMHSADRSAVEAHKHHAMLQNAADTFREVVVSADVYIHTVYGLVVFCSFQGM